MNKDLFKYLNIKSFFDDYCPEVKSWMHKIRGVNGRGNPGEFSDQDKAAIKKALKKLFKDLDGSL